MYGIRQMLRYIADLINSCVKRYTTCERDIRLADDRRMGIVLCHPRTDRGTFVNEPYTTDTDPHALPIGGSSRDRQTYNCF